MGTRTRHEAARGRDGFAIGRRAVIAGLLGAVSCHCDNADTDDEAQSRKPDQTSGREAVEVAHSAAPAWGQALASSGPKEAELARDPGHPALQRALQADEAIRTRAIWALARIGGEQARRTLEQVARSGDTGSAALAAISFLEPPRAEPSQAAAPSGSWRDLEDAVWSRYAVTEDVAQAQALLLAAARIGGAASQQRLAADTEVAPTSDDAVLRHVAALQAMGILCARGHGLQRAGLRSIGTALVGQTATAEAAAFALSRCAGPSAEQLAGEERSELVQRIEPLLGSGDDASRQGWRALASLGEMPSSVPAAVLHPSKPPAWTTEVEAVRALAAHADGRTLLVDRLASLPPASLEGTRVHVVLEALRSLRDGVVGTPELMERLRPWSAELQATADKADGRAAKAHGLIRCEARLLAAIAGGALEPVRSCGVGVDGIPPTHGQALVVEALLRGGEGLSQQQRVDALIELAKDPRPRVAAPALAALADLDDAKVNPTLVDALSRDDAGLRAAAAGAIAARAVDAARRDPEALPALVRLAGVQDAGMLEPRLAAIEALGSLARSAPEGSPAPWLETVIVPLQENRHVAVRRMAREALLGRPELVERFDRDAASPDEPFDPRVREALQDFEAQPARGIAVRTDAGTFTIAFEGASAQIAQAVLTSLARRGYYDGLTFHRVVPAFVVQGGDPRGDGYGGPGFVMPCERSNVRYERGTVGIALAGKDTGGSQFFVTHTPQPHLDARYPVIGFVSTEEQSVIDEILPYDRILGVDVFPGEPGS